MPPHALELFVITLGAATVNGALGYGFSSITVPLALLFLTVSAVVVSALVGFTTTSSSATTALRAARGTDYDATSAMQAAIATIRVGTTEGYPGSCLTGGFTPGYSRHTAGSSGGSRCRGQASRTRRRKSSSISRSSGSALSTCRSTATPDGISTNRMNAYGKTNVESE